MEKGDYASFSDYEFATVSNLAIGAGVVIVVVTFLGVVGSIKENKIMLLMVRKLFQVNDHSAFNIGFIYIFIYLIGHCN